MTCLKNNSAFFLLLLLFVTTAGFSQTYTSKNVKVNLFSSTPIEDIKASSNRGSGVIISQNGQFAFQVPIKSFQFAKGLMQEHFNENYLESDKYPYAQFKGTIQQLPDLSKDGDYTVNAKGTLTVHGVSKERIIPAKVTVRNGLVKVLSDFKVACVDHNIKIPTLVITKVAEVIAVNVEATMNSLSK
ncbi:YceI family protein [Rubrolithibacter danxiaensis]|uniref:YceI family protein n=1 Tax=Rubrolithibacter danxiaensis TaxID=3390805 RepID=UPI003BF8AD66